MRRPDPIYVFDLDGTLLAGNSFRHWVLHLAFGRFPTVAPHRRAGVTLQVVRHVLHRRVLQREHVLLRRELALLWERLRARHGEASIAPFQLRLQRDLRPNLAELLRVLAQAQADRILASAASGCYAREFAARLGFAIALCSEDADNAGQAKLQRVEQVLQARQWTHRDIVFFTDHRDDLPLIRRAAFTWWLGSDTGLAEIRRLAPDAPIGPAREQPAASLLYAAAGRPCNMAL